jgi:PAS fold.
VPPAHRLHREPPAPPDALDALLGRPASPSTSSTGSRRRLLREGRRGAIPAVNDTLVRRLGRRTKQDLLGRTARDLFPVPLGERYLEQDLEVCRTGHPVEDLLELHLYPDGREGWCLTTKVPLLDVAGRGLGLAGTSRDVRPPDAADGAVEGLAEALRDLHERPGSPHRVEELAHRAGLSPDRFSGGSGRSSASRRRSSSSRCGSTRPGEC